MAILDGFPAASGTVDSTELRKGLAGLIIRDASGNARAGVFPRHANALVTSMASMNVSVAAFEGVAVRGGGPIFMANDGAVSVPIGAAPASNSRIAVVYFKQNESAAPYSDANDLPVLAVVAGTAAPAPVKPALPAGAVELATVLVPAGVAATNAGGVVITQTFLYTTTSGGAVWLRSAIEMAAWSPAAGALAYRIDDGRVYVRRGGAWTVEPGTVLGEVTASTSSGVAGTVLATVATAALLSGQEVMIHVSPVGLSNTPAGVMFFEVRYTTNGTTPTTGSTLLHTGRVNQPGGGSVASAPGVSRRLVMPGANVLRVSVFLGSGIAYGADQQTITIVAA